MDLRRKKDKREMEQTIESDNTFAFIAGYTEGGFPYGLTWEELGNSETEEREEILPFR